VPRLALALLLIVILAVLLGLGLSLRGPAQMDGDFNVVVAETGVLDGDGQIQPSDDGRRVTAWILAGLAAAEAQAQAGAVRIWHDGLPWTEKGSRLGTVAGQTPPERAEAAGALAERVNAHVVVYAHIDATVEPAELSLEFYVSPRVRVESAATIGRYRLGDPLPVPADLGADPLALASVGDRVADRAGLLFWLLLAMRDDLLGRPTEALAILRQAEFELDHIREQGDGKEHLYYFKGRSALFLDFYAEAEADLLAALRSNPNYARAYIALGSVYLDQAQTLEAPQQRLIAGGTLERATERYRQGLRLAREANDPQTEIVAHLALGHAYRLEAESHYALGQFVEAEPLFDLAIDELRTVLDPLEGAEQYRLLAQAFAALGAAHTQYGQLLQVRGDLAESRDEYGSARTAYAGCIAQGDRAPEDELLASEIIGHAEKGCRHWDQVVEEILEGLSGG
jgi:tetratricopeptide (TPR) repeat protein